jgi:hypothetical protein
MVKYATLIYKRFFYSFALGIFPQNLQMKVVFLNILTSKLSPSEDDMRGRNLYYKFLITIYVCQILTMKCYIYKLGDFKIKERHP